MSFDATASRRIWCRCDCGKLHACAGASPQSVCACGRKLGQRLFDDAAPQQPPPSPSPSAAEQRLGLDRP